MFWKYNNNSSSEIDALLAKEDVTLSEVMDAEDIINQCKVQSKTLIDFLLKPEHIDELVNLTTREPSVELDERVRFKYPNIACELLTSDVPAINERLASEKELLDKLYGFLECEPPLNPLLASYFSRIMGALIAKKTEQNWLSYQFTCLQVLDFLKAKDSFISLLLKHLGTSAIMDLMLKLMTQVETIEMRQNILNWLDSQQIMQSLVSLLNAKVDKERHYNVAQMLCDFVRVARDTQRNSTERVDPDPLLNTLESSETVTLMLDNMFEDDQCESAIIGGIQVLLALLDVNQSSIPKLNSQTSYNSNINEEAVDVESKEKVVESTIQAIRGRMKDFHNLLLARNLSPIKNTVGVLDPPLGNTRLQVAKLLAAIVTFNDRDLLDELVTLGTFPVLLDLFFKYTWNNFLHTQVENCLVSALRTHVSDDENDENSNALTRHLLMNCKLIERLVSAWKENEEGQKEEKGVRKGYMGHLISIINKIVELCSNSALGQYLDDNLPETARILEEFKEGALKEANALQDTLLGGVYPNTSNEENEEFVGEYADLAFHKDQAYANYQLHLARDLASNCMDHLGPFNDDAFNDGDDTLQTIDHRTDLNFSLTDDDLELRHELFKQTCDQTLNTFGDVDEPPVDEGEHTLPTVVPKEELNDTVYSDDSDGDTSPVNSMDVDPWALSKSIVGAAAVPTEDPWGSPPTSDPGGTDSNWADFNSASFDNVAVKSSGDAAVKMATGLKLDNPPPPPPNDISSDGCSQTDRQECQLLEAKDNNNSAAGDVAKSEPSNLKPNATTTPTVAPEGASNDKV